MLFSLKSGNIVGTIPKNMCYNLSKLEELYLSDNNLFGQISTNLFVCKSLRILALETNKLSGSIPREIGNLTMLEKLYVSDNDITGT